LANTNTAGEKPSGYYIVLEGEATTNLDFFGFAVGLQQRLTGDQHSNHQVNQIGDVGTGGWSQWVGTYDGATSASIATECCSIGRLGLHSKHIYKRRTGCSGG